MYMHVNISFSGEEDKNNRKMMKKLNGKRPYVST